MKNIAHITLLVWASIASLQLGTSSLARAEEQVTIELPNETAYGSGASTSDSHYYPGGVPNVGLYIGNPNTTIRNDRGLFMFDITPLLLKLEKIKKAELIFSIDYYDSKQPRLELEVERFRTTLDALSGQELNNPDVEVCGIVEITSDDSVTASGAVRNVAEKTLDVTEWVKTDIKEGLTTSTYRFGIPEIEGKYANPSHGVGISVDKARRPVLQVTLEN